MFCPAIDRTAATFMNIIILTVRADVKKDIWCQNKHIKTSRDQLLSQCYTPVTVTTTPAITGTVGPLLLLVTLPPLFVSEDTCITSLVGSDKNKYSDFF